MSVWQIHFPSQGWSMTQKPKCILAKEKKGKKLSVWWPHAQMRSNQNEPCHVPDIILLLEKKEEVKKKSLATLIRMAKTRRCFSKCVSFSIFWTKFWAVFFFSPSLFVTSFQFYFSYNYKLMFWIKKSQCWKDSSDQIFFPLEPRQRLDRGQWGRNRSLSSWVLIKKASHGRLCCQGTVPPKHLISQPLRPMGYITEIGQGENVTIKVGRDMGKKTTLKTNLLSLPVMVLLIFTWHRLQNIWSSFFFGDITDCL